MIRSRFGLKVFGLCVLALGLTALAAGTAQAEKSAFWTVVNAKGELIKIPGANDLLPQLATPAIENKTGTLLFTTKSGTKVGILCTTMEFNEGGKLTSEGSISLGRILFHGCITFLNDLPSPPCLPHSLGQPNDLILTLKLKGLIVLDKLESGEVDSFVKFVPDEGKLFVKIELGEECSIGTSVNVEAKTEGEGFWVKDCKGNTSFKEEKSEHLFEEALHGITALGQPATIDGSGFARLEGAEHFGLKWGGIPG